MNEWISTYNGKWQPFQGSSNQREGGLACIKSFGLGLVGTVPILLPSPLILSSSQSPPIHVLSLWPHNTTMRKQRSNTLESSLTTFSHISWDQQIRVLSFGKIMSHKGLQSLYNLKSAIVKSLHAQERVLGNGYSTILPVCVQSALTPHCC